MKNKGVCVIAFLLIVFYSNGQIKITGKVTDNVSNPISFVTVHLLNTQLTTYTNKEGNFSINNVRSGKYIIELSSVGYATVAKEIEVRASDNQAYTFQLQNS